MMLRLLYTALQGLLPACVAAQRLARMGCLAAVAAQRGGCMCELRCHPHHQSCPSLACGDRDVLPDVTDLAAPQCLGAWNKGRVWLPAAVLGVRCLGIAYSDTPWRIGGRRNQSRCCLVACGPHLQHTTSRPEVVFPLSTHAFLLCNYCCRKEQQQHTYPGRVSGGTTTMGSSAEALSGAKLGDVIKALPKKTVLTLEHNQTLGDALRVSSPTPHDDGTSPPS